MHKKRGNPLICVRVTKELKAELTAIAEETGSTVSEVVRAATEALVKALK
ncbi:MAG TPA: ribbon-helix-helix protein, CopG family [Candidatus Pullichristensenella avicola]|nr:ribbon-helix-helix protein, CopG family [Candidatus Pullichristensenella avicola]